MGLWILSPSRRCPAPAAEGLAKGSQDPTRTPDRFLPPGGGVPPTRAPVTQSDVVSAFPGADTVSSGERDTVTERHSHGPATPCPELSSHAGGLWARRLLPAVVRSFKSVLAEGEVVGERALGQVGAQHGREALPSEAPHGGRRGSDHGGADAPALGSGVALQAGTEDVPGGGRSGPHDRDRTDPERPSPQSTSAWLG